jgi:hypothetical protein
MSQKEELLWDRIAKLTRERDEARAKLDQVRELVREAAEEERECEYVVNDLEVLFR